MAKSALLIFLLVALTAALPFREQIALVNSLEVGRDEDPETWGCTGCDESNRPLKVYSIEENVKQVKAELAVYEEYTVLAFRYTATALNLWEDLLWAFQRQDEHAPQGCKVQKEYDIMWNRIRDETIAGLRKYVHTRRLILTGISLGGSLAALSYVDIKYLEDFDNVEVILFGAPKVGNRKWAKWWDSIAPDAIRITLWNDPIRLYPVCFTPICTYKQIGTKVTCYPKKKLCKVKSCKLKAEEDEISYTSEIAQFRSQLMEHKQELKDGDLQGILAHIFGYKKIKDFDLCL